MGIPSLRGGMGVQCNFAGPWRAVPSAFPHPNLPRTGEVFWAPASAGAQGSAQALSDSLDPGLRQGARLGSGLALRFDEGGGDGFLGGLVGPEDELEDRVEALAFLDRRFDQSLGLLEAEGAAILVIVE